jgi:hypothetical protein
MSECVCVCVCVCVGANVRVAQGSRGPQQAPRQVKLECILYRMCSLQNVFSTECVLSGVSRSSARSRSSVQQS